MNVVLGLTTRWVASALETQYKVVVADESIGRYTFADNGATMTVRKDQEEYLVVKATWACDCEFASTMKLSCRHAMLYKKSIGSSFMNPFAAIQPRWFGQSRSSPDQVTELAIPFVAKVFKEGTRSTSGSLSEREKYRQAQQGFGRISSELTQFSDDAFKSAMNYFDEWWHNMRQGKITAITVVDSAEETMESGDTDVARIKTGQGETRAGESRGGGGSGGGGTQDSDVTPTVEAPTQTAASQFAIRLNGSAPKSTHSSRHKIKELKATPCFMWKVETSFVPETVRYLLPEDLIYKALEKLKQEKATMHGGQPISESIAVDANDSDDAPVVVIQNIGEISLEQLEAMKYIWNLGKMCSEGRKCITWLFSDVKQVVFNQSEVVRAADEIRRTWPYMKVPNMSSNFTYAELYRFRSGKWLRDGSIRAFTEYLRQKYCNNVTVFMPTASSSTVHGESEVADILPRATLVELRNTWTVRSS
ncbi:unnamed protein product [Phytophthora fragariaefolia]|uniref:Unnamed protein product n=1 Tax=Phytophthora fragariaefolia TaxID=1490495 RepID=A0A9W6YBY9_9STRA|nr:unnamed protein product [Phytophthora fragariaefolia]